MRKIIGIIPARMASTRFPGKPLAKINGMPMIGHVYFRSKMSESLSEVYVATCDREVMEYAQEIGAKAVITLDTHQRASDRASEATLKIESEAGRADIVVLIQGDEPMLYPEMIDLSIQPLLNDESIGVVNLMAALKNREEQDDLNQVKVVVDLAGFALYFSREPIPSWKKGAKEVPMYKQVPIIPFRRDMLFKFNELAPTPLEVIESVDMLRFIEHGYKIKMVLSNFDTHSVDTTDDLRKVEDLMRNDRLVRKYTK